MTRSRRGWIGAAVIVIATATPASAQEDSPESPATLAVRPSRFARDPESRQLQVSVSFRDVVDDTIKRKLQSGFPTVISFGGYIFPEGSGNNPRAAAGLYQSCRIMFDVWNEVYQVRISRPSGDTTTVVPNLAGVLRRCAELRDLPIRGDMNVGNSYFLAATVEVNPISEEMLEQIRRWVTRPPGSGAVTPGDSIFGSFVGLFVARIGHADRTLTFRTSGFVVPP